MTLNVDPTRLNEGLASTVNDRIAADTRSINRASSLVAAKSAMWRFGGASALVLATGAAVGMGLFGYSYVTDNRAAAEKIADAMGKALEKVTLRTTGDVKLDPEASVKLSDKTVDGKFTLDPNATVRLDANGAVVRLDPNSTVRVTGMPEQQTVPRPTAEQLRPDYGGNTKGGVTATNYTVFKERKYSRGEVHTGWKFTSNDQTTPVSQYCYYVEHLGNGADVKIDLGDNGMLSAQSRTNKTIDVMDASGNCVWWDGMPTRSAMLNPPVPGPAPDVVPPRSFPRSGVITPRGGNGPGSREGNPIIPNSGGKTF